MRRLLMGSSTARPAAEVLPISIPEPGQIAARRSMALFERIAQLGRTRRFDVGRRERGQCGGLDL